MKRMTALIVATRERTLQLMDCVTKTLNDDIFTVFYWNTATHSVIYFLLVTEH